MIKRGNQALQLQQIFIVRAELLLQNFGTETKNSRILTRVHRKPMLKIENTEFTLFGVKCQLQFSAIKHGSILIAQYRNQNFSLQFVFKRIPIDIEELRVCRCLAILQYF